MSPQPRLRLGCGDIWESVVSQPWPQTWYQFLQQIRRDMQNIKLFFACCQCCNWLHTSSLNIASLNKVRINYIIWEHILKNSWWIWVNLHRKKLFRILYVQNTAFVSVLRPNMEGHYWYEVAQLVEPNYYRAAQYMWQERFWAPFH